MLNGSPLGKYAAPAAAVASLAIIGVYLVALVFGHSLSIDPNTEGDLKALAFLAAGALFGSAVAVNGYKAPLSAAQAQVATLTDAVSQLHSATVALHKRADAANLPPAGDGIDPAAVVVPVVPAVAPEVAG